MTTTVNISLPKSLYEDAKKAVGKRGFSSFSEFIRDTLREALYGEDKNRITENGFPVWFEDKVLEAEREPEENDIVLKTEKDIHRYFLDLNKRVANRKH